MAGKNIQVAIKVRPLLEKEAKLMSNWRIVDNSIQLVESQTDPFYFDHIFNEDVTNQIIFDKVAKPIVDATLKGFNGTIFAYGQTSSGKTYTMLGDEINPGVMVLAAKEIFKEIENASDRKFLLRVGYIEIYNEKIYDLLNKNNQDLKIHETQNGDVSVNCEDPIITSEAEMMHYLQTGSKLRKCGETNMNERSSRSHALFRMIIESRRDDNDDGCVQTSILNLVDLAGSERADQTGATGSRLTEGRHINRSLLYLSCVIKRLSENESDKYINYRDSKLTRILQASLGGNALTAIICTIKPTSVEETNSTLSFAMRAKTIKNKPEVNETVSDAALMKRLEKEITRLKSELEVEKNKNSKIYENQMRVLQLEAMIKEQSLKIIHSSTINSKKESNARRRTWCPSSTEVLPENLRTMESPLIPNCILTTTRPEPFLTPLITLSDEFINNGNGSDSFFDKQMCDNKSLTNSFLDITTPKNCNVKKLSSLTPSPGFKTRYNELLSEMEDLRVFTSLEKSCQVEHETISSLSRKIQESQNVIAELRKQESTLKLVIEDLNEEALNSKEKFMCLESKITQDTKDFQNILEQKNNQNQKLLENNQELKVKYRDQINIEYEYEQFRTKSKNREAELIDSLNEKNHEICNLNKELEKIRRKDRFCNRCNLDTDVICKSDKNIDIFKLENKRIQKEYDELSNELMVLKQENERLRNSYSIAENEISSLNLTIAEFLNIKNYLIEYKAKILQNNDILNETITFYEKKNYNIITELKYKNKKFDEIYNENLKLSQNILVLETKLTEIQLEKKNLQDSLLQYETKYNILLKEIDSEKNIEIIKLENERIQKEYDELSSELMESIQENERLRKKISSLNLIIDEFQEIKNDLIYKSEKNIEIIKLENSRFQKEYDELSSELMESIQENERLRNNYNTAQNKISSLNLIIDEFRNIKNNLIEYKAKILQNNDILNETIIFHEKTNYNIITELKNKNKKFDEVYNENRKLTQNILVLEKKLTEIHLENQNLQDSLFQYETKYKNILLTDNDSGKNIEIMQFENRRIQKDYDELSSELMELKQENERLRNSYSTVENKTSSLKVTVDEFRNIKNDLIIYKEKILQNNDILNKTIILYEKRNYNIITELKIKNKKFDEIYNENLKLSQNILVLEKKLTEIHLENQNLQDSLLQSETKYNILLKEMDSEKNKEIIKLESERFQKEYDELSYELVKSKQEYEKLRNSYSTAESKINSLNLIINNFQEIESDLIYKSEKNIEMIKLENKRIQKENAELSSKLVESKHENERLRNSYSTAENKISTLNLIIDEFQEIKNKLIYESEKNIKVIKLDNKRIQKEYDELSSELVKLKQEYEKLRNSYSTAESKINSLNLIINNFQEIESDLIYKSEKNIEMIKLENKRIQNENAELSSKLVESKHENERLRNSYTTAENKIKSLNLIVDEFLEIKNKLIYESEKNIKVIKLDNKRIQKEYDELSSELVKSKQEYEKLRNSYSTAESKINSLNLIINNFQEIESDLIYKSEKNIEMIKLENKRIQKENAELSSKLVESKHENERLRNSYSTAENKIKSLNLIVDEFLEIKNQLINYKTQILQNNDILNKTITLYGKRNYNIITELKIKNKKFDKVYNENLKLSQDVSALEKKLTLIVVEKRNLQDSLLQYDTKYNILLKENDTMVQDKVKRQIIEIETSRQNTQKDRKCKRQSTHDEKRQCLWDSQQTVSTMTSPTDQLCGCVQLNEKVSELKKKLLIKNSQIETLRLELKTNPLKDDIKMLQKDILKEQNKNKQLLLEIAALKKEIIENNTAASTNSVTKESINMESVCAEDHRILKQKYQEAKVLCYNRIEQIRDLEKQIYELHLKYNSSGQMSKEPNADIFFKKFDDLKTICRLRAARIKELETELEKFRQDSDIQIQLMERLEVFDRLKTTKKN